MPHMRHRVGKAHVPAGKARVMMLVRRTGAKRGESPTWYVAANSDEEIRAIEAGYLADVSPSRLYRHVLLWGSHSRAEAEDGMRRLQPIVDAAVALVLLREEA